MSSSPPPFKKRKVNTTNATDIEKNDNIKSLLSTLFDPHGKRKSKKRKVDATIKTVHTPSTTPSAAVAQEKKSSDNAASSSNRQYMKWEDRFNQAKQYYSPNGELIRELPKEIYKWIAQQRCAYRKNKLRNDRLIALQSFQNSLLLGNKDRVFKCYRSYQQQRIADPTKYSGWQEIQYKEWQKKVWPNTTEETTSIARGGGNAATATENTSPTSSMDAALLSAS